jgi:hypothetical protein
MRAVRLTEMRGMWPDLRDDVRLVPATIRRDGQFTYGCTQPPKFKFELAISRIRDHNCEHPLVDVDTGYI